VSQPFRATRTECDVTEIAATYQDRQGGVRCKVKVVRLDAPVTMSQEGLPDYKLAIGAEYGFKDREAAWRHLLCNGFTIFC